MSDADLISIRPALPAEAPLLSELAARSEAHWGYDAAFMARFRELYRITEAFILQHTVWVAVEAGEIEGFYALVQEETGVELEYLFLDPACLGRGLGRKLWNHMADHCREKGITEVHLVCGPHPRAFYERMGAVRIGEVDSLIAPGRKVSRLIYSMGPKA